MARTDTLGHFLTDVADAIRTAEGSSAEITASDFDDRIEALSGGGSSNYNAELDISLYSPENMPDYGLKSLITNINSIDTSLITNFNLMFGGCINLTEIPLIDTSFAETMEDMFLDCWSLTEVPLLNTSNVTDMIEMFLGCEQLTTLPILDTSNVNDMRNMFELCINLTDTSLDNILQMCINAENYTETKTLAALGFEIDNYPASRIEALPHYQDFINANWTIGY